GSALHRHFSVEAEYVVPDRGNCLILAAATIRHRDPSVMEVAEHFRLVPAIRVTNVGDGSVVMRAPEEWHCDERLAWRAVKVRDNVVRGRRSLALCDDPVLYSATVAAHRVSPLRNVTRGVHARRARLEELVDDDATIHRQSRLTRERNIRTHTDPGDYKIRLQSLATREQHVITTDRRQCIAQMECRTVVLVDPLNDATQLSAKNAFERAMFRCNDVNMETARAQRGGDFETDEAGANHNGVTGVLAGRNDRARVRQRPQIHDPLQGIHARWQPHRRRASREQQCIISDRVAVTQLHDTLRDIDLRRANPKSQRYPLFLVNGERPEWDPLLWRGASQIILR